MKLNEWKIKYLISSNFKIFNQIEWKKAEEKFNRLEWKENKELHEVSKRNKRIKKIKITEKEKEILFKRNGDILVAGIRIIGRKSKKDTSNWYRNRTREKR